ncbi:MAG: M14 family metallopeptidase, partial [Bacteroidales bacterium]|nr:M14 family metallopeptidase [Bacteroidales bacterium]
DLFTVRYLRAQGYPVNVDPNAWEHNQGWPSARLNHYLFDLNRDWSWQVQQETQMRMKLYNEYMPQVHADFHEMGSGSSFFFAPGAEPWHEVITTWQHDFHKLAGDATAKIFDEKNMLYFTKDNFDLFCPSFGDTWPLFNGAMGFTLEQGGGAQAGIAMKRDERDTLTLANRIQGHFLGSMAIIKTASDNRIRLLKEFYDFFKSAAANPSFKYKTVIIKGSNDPGSLSSLKDLLDRNQIIYSIQKGNGKKMAGFDYRANKEGSVTPEKGDILIHAAQPQGRLMQVYFEPDSYSSDSLSYDLTAWSLPYVFNIESYAVTEKISAEKPAGVTETVAGPVAVIENPYAYVAEKNGFNELKFLALLYKAGLNVRSSLKPFTMGGKSYDRGTVVIARGDNTSSQGFDEKVKSAAAASDVTIITLATGMVTEGKDIGSDYMPVKSAPSVVLAGGEGTTSSFGEIWYFLERELEYPVTIVEADEIADTDLSDYDILILPGGNLTKSKDRIMAFA